MHKTDTSYDNSFEENSENIHADSTHRIKRTHKSTETQTDSHCEIEKADKASQTNEACSIRVSYCTLCVVCIYYFLCHPVEFMKVVLLVAIGYIGYLILFSRVGKAIQTYVSSSQPTVVSNKTNYSLRNDSPISEENNHLQETSKRGVRRKTASSSIVDKPLRDETTSRILLAVTDRSQTYEIPDKTLSNQRKNYQDKSNSVKTSIPHGDRFIEKDNISSPNTCISEKSSRAEMINSPMCILLGNKSKEPEQTTSSLKHRFRSDKNEERLTSRIEDNKTDKTKTYKVGPFDSGTKKSKQPIADYFQSEKREEKTTVYMTGISCKCKRLPKKETAIAASSKESNFYKVRSARATSSHSVRPDRDRTQTRNISVSMGASGKSDSLDRKLTCPTPLSSALRDCKSVVDKRGRKGASVTKNDLSVSERTETSEDISTTKDNLRKSASFPKIGMKTCKTQGKIEFSRSKSFVDEKRSVRLFAKVDHLRGNKKTKAEVFEPAKLHQNQNEKQNSSLSRTKDSAKFEILRKHPISYDEVDGIDESSKMDSTLIYVPAKDSTNESTKTERLRIDSNSGYDEIDGISNINITRVNAKAAEDTPDAKGLQMEILSKKQLPDVKCSNNVLSVISDSEIDDSEKRETQRNANTSDTEIQSTTKALGMDSFHGEYRDRELVDEGFQSETIQINTTSDTNEVHGVLSETFLSKIAKEIGKDWEMFFLTIGLTTTEVDHVHMDNPFNSEIRNLKAFLQWRCKNKEKCALDQLKDLIQAFSARGRQDLIDKYTGFMDESQLPDITAFECAEEPGVDILRPRLMKIYNEIQEIPLSPVQEGGDKLPIQQLFSSVVIKEEPKESRRRKSSVQDKNQELQKEVKSPDDLLTKNGEPVPRVFMLGDAAHGKTTYCVWLLKTWCSVIKSGKGGRPLNEWENALSQFDFVFYLQLRHVDTSRANLIDMVCQDLLGTNSDLKTTAKHVLSSEKYRCFIMMDGLDEWKPNQLTVDQLKFKGMPNIENMSNCVIFTTMRPWKYPDVAKLVHEADRVIEIKGLDDKGIEAVIEKVLVHYYEMTPDSPEYESKRKEMIRKLEDETLKSFVKIPLLAVVCVQIWYEGDQIGETLTGFYVAMVNMLIERAHIKQQTQQHLFENIDIDLPRIFSSMKNIRSFFNVLLKLGKVAYEGLLSHQMQLVFQVDHLETEIGEKELKFALAVGLISQNETRGITARNVVLHFFHKTVQEFLAAIFIVYRKDVSDTFCEHLCDIKTIMELSYVITFICGMCPSLGSVISQHVASVTDSDKEICKYRKSPEVGNTTVKELYRLQMSWYRELQYGQNESPATFHVSDVCLFWNSDIDTVRVTRELLSNQDGEIRSLLLWQVPTDKDEGICNTELRNFIRNPCSTRSLVMLYISGYTDRIVPTITISTLRSFNLYKVTVLDCDDEHRPLMTNMDLLESLSLWGVNLGDRDLGLTQHMTQLQDIFLRDVELKSKDMGLSVHMSQLKQITLWTVKMAPVGWGRFVESLTDIHHQFAVRLDRTDINEDSISRIRSSKHFSVTRYDDKHNGVSEIKLTRVWPPKEG